MWGSGWPGQKCLKCVGSGLPLVVTPLPRGAHFSTPLCVGTFLPVLGVTTICKATLRKTAPKAAETESPGPDSTAEL